MSQSEKPSAKSFTFDRATESTVRVSSGDQLFTTLDFGSYAKPVFYPVQNPAGIGMTRSWPLRDDVAGEEHDHPHHKSLWFAHEINGVDFWHETTGRIDVAAVQINEGEEPSLSWSGRWVERASEKTICTDETVVRFLADTQSRSIRYKVSVIASEGPITFVDTKEGSFALRIHPHLRLTPKPEVGIHEVFGSAINSEGQRDVEAWGKHAKWVLYAGMIEGQSVAIAVFDHPENLRHPTTWHARDYGLFAANPFGLHDFEGKPLGTGEHRVAADQRLTQRYQATFFQGQPTLEEVEQRWENFANQS